MKITLDKNFALIQLVLVIVFYVINDYLLKKGMIISSESNSKCVDNSKKYKSKSKPKTISNNPDCLDSILALKFKHLHFYSSCPIKSKDLMLYVLSNQFAVPGSIITPKSNQAIFIATLQRVLFLFIMCGALQYDKLLCNLTN